MRRLGTRFINTFRTYLQEAYLNLIGDDPRKDTHAAEVHGMLQKAYAPIGGIKGSGFSSPEDMKKNIHMWKLTRRAGKITSAVMYKNNAGNRKRVAVATNQTPQGKADLVHTLLADHKHQRGFSETSGPLLHVLVKHLGDDIHNHVVPREHVNKYISDTIHPVPDHDEVATRYPHLRDHLYQRQIGSSMVTKLMLGKKVQFFSKGKT